MVKLIAASGKPSGYYKAEVLKEDIWGRFQNTGEVASVPVVIAPEGADIFQYRDDEHRSSVLQNWATMYEARDVDASLGEITE